MLPMIIDDDKHGIRIVVIMNWNVEGSNKKMNNQNNHITNTAHETKLTKKGKKRSNCDIMTIGNRGANIIHHIDGT